MSTTSRTAALAIFLCAPSAFGIVIRHDRDDARYLELAEHYRAPVAALSLGGLGTLIQPTWLATAAHVA